MRHDPVPSSQRGSGLPKVPPRPRGSLFRRYLLSLYAAIAVPIMVGGASEAWFGYRDQRGRLDELLRSEARLAADRIQGFLDGVRDSLSWTVQLPWETVPAGQEEARRVDALRVLRQAPAITALTLVDSSGHERLAVSRLGLDRAGPGEDLSATPPVVGARSHRTNRAGGAAWYGPLTFERGSEPYMIVATAGNRGAAGVAVAEVNLKLVWDVVSRIRVGETGYAFVLDAQGRLVAHPDLSLVLQGEAAAHGFATLRAAITAGPGTPAVTTDRDGRRVVAIASTVRGAEWTVVVTQPLAEAFAPIRRAAWRVAGLLALGALLALALAYGLARHMAGPTQVLEAGVRRIGAGQFDRPIVLTTGDELEGLAERINEMAAELAASQEKGERIARLRRFLAPQVAALVERSGDDRLLEGRRQEVVAVFGDLRGFTGLAARAEPEVVMGVLAEYHAALGGAVARHGATLTSFSGDGFMALFNAPVACPEPVSTALRFSLELQEAVQAMIPHWRARGHVIGFGLGLAAGPATVGRIGCEGRLDYTAIGSAVNLAARLCAAAVDGQVLCDERAATAGGMTGIALSPLGPMTLRGFDAKMPVFVARARPDTAGSAPPLPRPTAASAA